MKTTAAQAEINNLRKINQDLLIARQDFPITSASCTWVVLTTRIIENEQRIKELQSS